MGAVKSTAWRRSLGRPLAFPSGSVRGAKSKHRDVFARRLWIEPLESRQLLSVGMQAEADAPLTALAITPSLTSGTVDAGTQLLAVGFSKTVVGGNTAANYELREAGADGLLSTADDTILTLTPYYSGTTVTLSTSPLMEGLYRLTVRDTITDASGNKLDGDGDGAAGGNWVQDFVVTPGASLLASNPLFPTGGSGPQWITSGDLDGDGKPDLVITNNLSSNIAILRGTDGGGFTAPTTFSSGGSAPRVNVVADFNNDGKLDVAVANYSSNKVAVRLGDGAGNFGAATTVSSGGTGPSGLASGDFNGDGKTDLIVDNSTGATLCVLLGDGNGGFTPQATAAGGGTSSLCVAVGDFNADGKLDASVANLGGNSVGVLLGDGSGGLAAATTFATVGTSPTAVAVGDFNADGKLDLVTANSGSSSVSILLGNGSGGFAAAATYGSGGSGPYALAVADVNVDGKSDLLVDNNSGNTLGVLLGNGSGGFAAAKTFASSGSQPYAAAAADFNGDGKPDVAVVNVSTSTYQVFLGSGSGDFSGPMTYAAGGNSSYSVAVADFNGDGKPDLAATSSANNSVGILLGTGNSRFSAVTTFSSGGTGTNFVATADFNRDGKMDVVATSSTTATVGVLLGDGSGHLGAATTFASGGSGPACMATGDFNGDHVSDLVVANVSADTLGILIGDGSGGFSAAATVSSGGTDPHSIAVSDFNGDGNADLAVANYDNGSSSNLAVLLGDGYGGFAAATTFAPGGTYTDDVVAADFNDDGKVDLALVNASATGTVGVLLGNGSGGFSSPTTVVTGANTNSLAVGDFNADGKLDLAACISYGEAVLLFGNGSGGFTVATTVSAGATNSRQIVVGDFNGDGRSDLAVANSTNSVSILPNLYGPAPVTLTSAGGLAFDIAAGDFGAGQLVQGSNNAFDGDGRLLVGGTPYTPTLLTYTTADSGHSVITGTDTVAGLTVSRKVTVPNTGSQDFARTIDSFTNATGATINTTVTVVGNLGSDTATNVFATSSGDMTADATDRWVGTDDAEGTGTPAVIHYIHGYNGISPSTTTVSNDNINWTYNLSVPAGQTVRLAYFTIVAATRSAATAAANALVTSSGFGGQSTAYLTSADVQALSDFIGPNTAPTDVTLSAASVPENQAAGTVVGTLATVDANWGDTFTYALVDAADYPDNNAFTITSGQLKTNAVFDYEIRSSYSILVQTTDAGGMSFQKQFTITVTDVPGNPTDISLSATSVAENQPASTVVGTLSSTDAEPPAAPFTYALVSGTGSTDNGSFTITGNQLKTTAPFDYETKASYSILVQSTDAGGLTFQKQFTIAVADVNVAPSDITLSAATVAEDQAVGTVAGVFSSTDAEPPAGPFTYILVSGAGSDDNASFTISGEQLKTSAVFDYETKSSYSIRVQTADAAGLTFQKQFTISVVNLAEASSVGDRVWQDVNGNGVQDAGEPGVAGAIVEVFQSYNAVVGDSDDVSKGIAITDANGNYTLGGLTEGLNHYLVVHTPVGYTFTGQDQGTSDAADSDVNSVGMTALIAPASSQTLTDLDAGLIGAVPSFGFAAQAGSTLSDSGYRVATDTAGNAYVAGTFFGTCDFDQGPGLFNLGSAGSSDAFVAKFTAAGALVWARNFGGASTDAGTGLALAADGNVYTTGYFQGTADFDPGPAVSNLTSVGSYDVFVCKLDAAGNFLWAKGFGGTDIDNGLGIALAADGGVVTTGVFVGTVDFNPGSGTYNLTSAGSQDVFLAKLDASGNFLWADRMGGVASDYGYGVAVGPDGGIYTTGYYSSTADFDPGSGTSNLPFAGWHDVFVSKVDASGGFLWARQLGGSGTEEGHGIAVAADGSAYITGYFDSTADFDPGAGTVNLTSAGGYDVFLAKLNVAGDYVWAKSFGGGASDTVGSVAVGTDGSPYVTGSFQGTVDVDPGTATRNLTSAGSTDAFVVKFDSAGGFAWAKTFGGTGGDGGNNLVVAADNRVYVTGGFAATADFDPGAGTFNLTSAGATDAFVCRFLPPAPPSSTTLFSSAVAENLAAGALVGDLASVDPDPTETFTYTLVEGAGSTDNASFTVQDNHLKTAVVFDYEIRSAYSVRVRAANSKGAWREDVFAIAVTDMPEPNTVGDLVWKDSNANGIQNAGEPGIAGVVVQLFQSTNTTVGDSDDVSKGTAITDAAGHYSFSNLGTGVNYYLVFRAPVGYTAFVAQDQGSNDTLDSDVSSAGVTAMFSFAAEEHRTSVDAGLTGTASTFGFALQAGSTAADYGRGVATDASGNVYVVGYFQGTADFDRGPGITNLTSAGNADVFVAKYTPTGALVWARRWGGTDNDYGYAVAVAADGSVYTTGNFIGAVDFDPGSGTANLTGNGSYEDVFISKLDGSGNYLWAASFGGSTADSGYGIAVAPDGGVVTSGFFQGTADFDPSIAAANLTSAGASDVFVVKLDGAGNYAWAKRWGGAYADVSRDVAVDGDGCVYTNGSFVGTVDFDPGAGTTTFNTFDTSYADVFVSKLDPSGNYLWAVRAGFAMGDYGEGIAVASDGSVYTTGYYSTTVDFDPGTGTAYLTSASGSADAFVWKLTSAGAFVWAKGMGGSSTDYSYAVAVGSDGSVYTTGAFQGTADFDPGAGTLNLASAGVYDIYLSKLDGSGAVAWAQRMGGSTSDYGYGIAVAPDGTVYGTGGFQTTADLDPSSGTMNFTSAGSYDAFLVRYIQPLAPTGTTLSNASVAENQASGTAVGDFASTDLNSTDTFTYTLVAGTGATDNASFTITGNHLKTAAAFDYETKASCSIRVRTTDSGSQYREDVFTISVTDLTAPPTDITLSNASVAENQPVGTVFGTLTSTDNEPPAGPFSYSLVTGTGDTDNALFALVVDQLQTNGVFDYEAKASYSIRVQTTDAGGLTFQKPFTVTVTDANLAPTDLSLSTAAVAENQSVGTVVGTFASTDAEAPAAPFTYTLVSGAGSDDNGLFSIVDGQLKANVVFDYETKAAYSIRAQTVDAGGMIFQKQFTIAVTDLPDTNSVGDLVWKDANGNGIRDAAEPGIAGAVVEVLQSTDDIIGNADDVSRGVAITDAAGHYLLGNLSTGLHYYLVVRAPAGYAFTTQDQGGDDADSDVDASGATALFTLAGDEHRTNLDAGLTGSAPAFGFALQAGSTADDQGHGVATDAAGNVYVAGNFQGMIDFDRGPGATNLTSAGGTDVYVAKYTPAGALVWARSMGGADADNGYGVALGPDGSVYATGGFTGITDFDPGAGTANLTSYNASYTDVFISKFDAAGNYLWAKSFTGNGADYGRRVAVLGDGSIYLAGLCQGIVDFDPSSATYNLTGAGSDDAFVAKLDASGNLAWAKRWGNAAADCLFGFALAADGSVYTTGGFYGTVDFDPGPGTANLTTGSSFPDIFVSKLDSAGNYLWAVQAGGGSTIDFGYGVAVAADGSVYVTGQYYGTVDFDPGPGTSNLTGAGGTTDAFVWKLTAAGALVWAKTLGGTSGECGYAITLGSDGGVYTTGTFLGTPDFDPGPGTWNLTSAGNYDAYLSKLDASGNIAWAKSVGGSNWDSAWDIAVAGDGRVYDSGYFSGTADLDPTSGTMNFTSAGSYDAFILGYIAPQAPTTTTLSNATLAENQPSGTAVGDFASTDINAGDTFAYSLVTGTGSTDNASFTITGNHLKTAASLDYETKVSYSIRVRTTDSDKQSREDIFLISVTDLTAPPTDIILTPAAVAENQLVGSTVGTFTSTDNEPPAGPFTYSLVTGAGDTDNGLFTLVGDQLQANAIFNYEARSSYSIRVQSTDTGGQSFQKQLAISVTNVNEQPTDLASSPAAVAENLAVGAVVGAFATVDPDSGNTFTYALTNTANYPDNASFTIAGGQLRTAAALDYEAKSSYTIYVRSTDQGSLWVEKALTVTVTNANDPPLAAADSLTVLEGGTTTLLAGDVVSVLANDTDQDGDLLTAVLVAGPQHGSLTLHANGTFRYTHDGSETAADSFTYKASDGQAQSNVATVSITITPVNDPPVAVADSIAVMQGQAATVLASGMASLLANDTDAEHDPLTAMLVTGPSYGELVLNPDGTFSYTHNDSNHFTDSFTYKVNDGTATSDPVTVSITITPTCPIVSVGHVVLLPGLAGQTVSFYVSGGYKVSGLDFAIRIGDGLNPVGAPRITAVDILGDAASPTIFYANNTGQQVIDLTSPYALATTTTAAGKVTAAGLLATVTFDTTGVLPGSWDLVLADPDGVPTDFAEHAAAITNGILTVNAPPAAAADTRTTAEDTPLSITAPGVLANDTDADSDPLTAELVSGPGHALAFALQADGSFTYTPAADYNGGDSFTYRAFDGRVYSDPATVSLTVTPVNDAPTAAGASGTTAETQPVVISLTGDDGDAGVAQALSFTLAAGPSHGSVEIDPATGQATYTPAADYNGADSFTFRVTDDSQAGPPAGLTSLPTRVSITITPVNMQPTAAAQTVTAAEDTAQAITLAGTDGDPEVAQVLTYAILAGPSHGTLSNFNAASGQVTYTPAANYNGRDSFTFTVTDDAQAGPPSGLTSTAATVSITVTPVNDQPTATSQGVTTAEDAAKSITLAGTDGDAEVTQSLTFAILAGPIHGTLTNFNPSTGTATYTPAANYNGADNFTFTVTDDAQAGPPSGLTSTAATVSITVTPVTDVVGREIFYNNSKWDAHTGFTNGDPAANVYDDAAIAPAPSVTDADEPTKQLGKQALLPGQKATFVNYTSYSRGINGIMVDFDSLGGVTPTAADFAFAVGNDNNPAAWPAGPAPLGVSVRHVGAAGSGFDRVTILWADDDPATATREAGSISKEWLQVKVLSTAHGGHLGLAADDTFLWGNAIGECGDRYGLSSPNAYVNATDEVNARNYPHAYGNLATIADTYDYNRDKYVNATDQVIARNNVTGYNNALKLLDLSVYQPAGMAPLFDPAATDQVLLQSAALGDLQAALSATTPTTKKTDATPAAIDVVLASL